MCGRFVVSYTYQDLLSFLSSTFDIFDLKPELGNPKYNIAPGTNVLSVINDGMNYRAGSLKWGFVPSFSKNSKINYKMINARIEGIENKPAFRDSFRSKRCLIIADGYYEWKKQGKQKLPYLISKDNKELFFFAGLYSKYQNDNNESIYTTTIITKKASNDLSTIHDRMPVILDKDSAKKWLNKDIKDDSVLLDILSESLTKELISRRVSAFVNNVRNDSIECIKEFQEVTLF